MEELEKRKSLGEEQLSPRERIERLERLEKDEILQQFSSESGLTIEEIKKRTKGLSNSQIRKKMIKYLSEGEKDG
jgi:hypothetical protein